MRNRYGGFRTKRTKKIRPLLVVKDRVAKRTGKCHACRGKYAVGDMISVVRIKRRVYHTATCKPANVLAAFASVFGNTPGGGGPVLINSSESMAKQMSANWTSGESKMVAMAALENALVCALKTGTTILTPEIEKAFDRYNKCKAMFLRPGSDNEGRQAALLAIVGVVKLVF